MTTRRLFLSTLVLSPMLVPTSAPAVVAMLPETVRPPFIDLRSECPLRIEAAGGTRIGAPVPIPALRLGAPVRRGTISFTTGGGGTANAAEAFRRKQAGLQYEPRTFDVAGTVEPEVYAAPIGPNIDWLPYQRLPLKAASPDYGPWALVFAQAISATTGRIVSVELTLRRPPVDEPAVRIVGGARSDRARCSSVQSLDVYAPAMTAEHIRRLFAPSGCNWYKLTECRRDERPRGTVLFVRPQGSDHVYRWIDYDALDQTPSTGGAATNT